MKKNLAVLLAVLLVWVAAVSQHDYIQRPTLGIFFFFNDFKTAADIRATSLRTVLRSGHFGKLKDMSPGLAVNYLTGLSKHFDFTFTLTGSFLDYTTMDGTLLGEDNLLLEGDVSLKAKIFSNRYWLSPFFQLGTGISKYRGYWGAFIPAGTGLQLNLFDEALLMFNAQYRIAVTNTTSNHFFYSIGLAGNIGRRKSGANGSSLPED
jgi:OOP family OmpA-OmpF porin